MERPGVARLLALALTAALIALSGCGDDDDTDADAPSGLPAAGGGGPLAYALPDLPPVLDPLAASDRAELTVVRQVHEPLVELLRGPYGEGSPQPGLALTVTPSRDLDGGPPAGCPLPGRDTVQRRGRTRQR
jgi:ABC-type oligopeptide transport system substrate-binding subunit